MLDRQPPCQLFVFRDVRMVAKDAKRFAILGPRHDLPSLLNPLVRAVFAPHPIFLSMLRGFVLIVSMTISYGLRAIVRMDTGCPFLEAVTDLILRVTEHVLPSA